MRSPTGLWRTFATLGAVAILMVACAGGPSETPSPTLPSVSSAATPSQTPSPTPTPSASPQPTPDQAHVPILQAGVMAATTTAVRVRDLPGTDWGVAVVLPPGAAVQVVLGPIRTDGFGWYLVRDADPAKP